jgi:hypothetical protein
MSCAFGDTVTAGPFTGLVLPPESYCSPPLPKRAGTYEKELLPWIDRILRGCPSLVVDVGAAEGYYAVGFARILPQARIVAFEADAHARELLGRCIALNQPAGSIEVRGWCDARAIQNVIENAASPCILIDAEGAEAEILNLEDAPGLAKARILVELHDFAAPGIRRSLEKRFAATHKIEATPVMPRSVNDYPKPVHPLLKWLFRKHIENALCDRWADHQEWLLMTPHAQL